MTLDAEKAGVPVVRGLVWETVRGEGVETYQATCATGIYRVFEDEDSVAGAVFAEFAVDESRFCMTDAVLIGRFCCFDYAFDEAKAAAQAYHEQCITADLNPDFLSALEASQAEVERLRGDGWVEGVPPSPWSKEWFIAETVHSQRVVLTALPEEYTYDFKTADDTYIMARNIKRWMPFPDSEYVSPATSALTTAQERIAELEDVQTAARRFMPHAQVAFLWSEGNIRSGEVDRYREAYRALGDALASARATLSPAVKEPK